MAQREIKFRAWLNEPDLMVFSNGQASTEECEIWVFAEGGLKIQIQQTTWKEGGGETFERIEYVDCDAKIMQFTGLHDKNGKEIYEGDIVKVGGLVEVVEIIDGMLCSYSHKIYGKRNTISIDDVDDVRVCDSSYFEPYEIIGNIYERPELLK